MTDEAGTTRRRSETYLAAAARAVWHQLHSRVDFGLVTRFLGCDDVAALFRPSRGVLRLALLEGPAQPDGVLQRSQVEAERGQLRFPPRGARCDAFRGHIVHGARFVHQHPLGGTAHAPKRAGAAREFARASRPPHTHTAAKGAITV